MRAARRKLPRQGRRAAGKPAARRAQAAATGSTVTRAVGALRRGREALSDIQAQLDTLLDQLRAPTPSIDASAPSRLASAASEASQALAALAELRALLPQRA